MPNPQTNWQIIKRKDYVNRREVLIETNEQKDDDGNIFQRGGGVIAKKCQQCKRPFASQVIEVEKKQDVPSYECQTGDCGFKASTGDKAFDHTLEFPEHSIIKTTTERVVDIERKLVGIIPKITIT